ncbi:RagB/SusD family nutrient uptake outer membrane protein [Pedobacter paludis]|uniref:RagB/SusD family nutrient uptake outer membrane protein n=1 Tax=Pedobacter paludis TaxID=2203212 RepID=A0A317F0B5_9SPHI|nr:RagB/SusD family nutrient uptake outer membrane protein [Pedobacter paludis]PWS32205.1 RagB/SusD family nutrient uptake outer membrane protein [Pedobacter paludis]
MKITSLNKSTLQRINLASLAAICLLMLLPACKKFVEVDPPTTKLNTDNVFLQDGTAISVVTGIFSQMSAKNGAIAGSSGDDITHMCLYPGLSADELKLFSSINSTSPLYSYYKNSLTINTLTGTDFWESSYSRIFQINSAIAGLTASNSLTADIKKQLLGESYFLRGLYYFYLTNLYGEVPIALTTDYSITRTLARSPQNLVYAQIKSDLIRAKELLSSNYLAGNLTTTTTDRVRPTKMAAAALLSRVALYTSDYITAENQASEVIANGSYDTVPLSLVFLKNSKETIWALQPVNSGTGQNTGEGALFNLPPSGPSDIYTVYLNPQLIDSFEAGDQRKTQWTNSLTVQGTTYNYAYKYQVGKVNTETVEFPIVLRLSEQYLIRAEARAMQQHFVTAMEDLNVIRRRAGLSGLSSNSTADALSKIIHERQVELFTEWGHRWLDLKRTGKINDVMVQAALAKGTTWDPKWALYPIPINDINRDPNLIQNPGY